MDIPQKDLDELWRKIAKLNELLWEGKAFKSNVDSWLNNFKDQDEKDHALYILSKFIYYGEIFVRELTRAIYRDLFRYPLIKEIRANNNDTMDEVFIEAEFIKQRDKTLILPMGGNSDSGGYLLYLFRQEGDHPMSLFNEDSKYTSTISARYYKDGSEALIEQSGKNPRMLTPRECARLQGFPEDFIIPVSNAQSYKQFGNSVCIPVIEAVAVAMLDYLGEYDIL